MKNSRNWKRFVALALSMLMMLSYAAFVSPAAHAHEAEETPAAAGRTVALDPGKGQVDAETVTVGEDRLLPQLPVPVRTGWDFVGWVTDTVTENFYGDEADETEEAWKAAHNGSIDGFWQWDIATAGVLVAADDTLGEGVDTLYALYTPKTYTIRWHLNGWKNETGLALINEDEQYGSPLTPVDLVNSSVYAWEDHTFEGWYTAPEGGVKWEFDTPCGADGGSALRSSLTVTGDLDLYAHWSGGQEAEKLWFTFPSRSVHPGGSFTVTVNYGPAGVNSPTVSWESSNEAYAAISGVSADTRTVTVTAAEDNGKNDGENRYVTLTARVGGVNAVLEITVCHTWDNGRTIKKTSCTEGGQVLYTCTHCGATMTRDYPADGHRYVYSNVDATCTEEGYQERVCYVCGKYEKDIVAAALGHSWSAAQAAGTQVCSLCGEVEILTVSGTPSASSPDGWSREDGKWYYYSNGERVTGFIKIDGEEYCFDNNGVMRLGWVGVGGGDFRYASASGALVSDRWVQDGGKYYYVKPNGLMARNEILCVRGGDNYAFDNNGVMQTGWIAVGDGDYYYALASGELVKNKWQKSSSKWYYLGYDGMMYRNGLYYIDGEQYYFHDNGSMRIGWVGVGGGDFRYASASGALVSDRWVLDGGKYYYVKPNGLMARSGILYVRDGEYAFLDSGVMRTGWVGVGGGDFRYASASGALVSDRWVLDGGKYYYVKPNGLMARNEILYVRGSEYYSFLDSGVMQTGWISVDFFGNYYYASASGELVHDGWVQSGGKWYYIQSDYYMTRSRTLTIKGEQYTFDINGVWDSSNSKSSLSTDAQAEAVAKVLVKYIKGSTDLERIGQAAQIVSYFCQEQSVYTMEGPNYSKPYGVFVAGEYSCAGSTRALGLMLTLMGYNWTHINPNQYTHQWCEVNVNGETIWADGQIGMVGYGQHPYAW